MVFLAEMNELLQYLHQPPGFFHFLFVYKVLVVS